MELGVCYYPEHWPPERWPLDAKLMREAGLSIVRIGEFAWQQMEPAEGEYTWAWLDKAIETLTGEGLHLVLGTPTATPPAWLCRAHPDILPVDNQGRMRKFGSRRHYCPNSATYHEHTRRIVGAMAKRYGQHASVVGWQIDNEFGCHESERCYCERCAVAFRKWLEAKYKTIEVLNPSWGNAFWSQNYGSFSEIDPPNLTVSEANPSHVLDYQRFCSDSFVAYQQIQLDVLRATVAKHQPITTNFMGNYPDLNYHDLAKPLDWVTWDSYPTGYAEFNANALYAPTETRPAFAYDVGDPYVTGYCHDLTRGLKQAPFWIMEQQCGNVNWSIYNTGVRPGSVRLWTWHALGAGASAVVYFRFRATQFAQEQMHSGLLHHDATPDVGYNELLSMLPDRERMNEVSQGDVQAEVAILLDYNDLWGVRLQPHRRDFSYMRHQFVYYRALQRLGIPCDIVPADADLSKYKLIITPTAFMASETLTTRLTEYVSKGGALLVGVRSGFKTVTNVVTDQPLPGVLRELVGATVTAWSSLPPGISFGLKSRIANFSGAAETWAESVEVGGGEPALGGAAESLITYSSGPYQGKSALTDHKLGEGRALYLGFYPTSAQAESLLAEVAQAQHISRLAIMPEGLIACKRGGHTVLLNFTDSSLAGIVNDEVLNVGARDVRVVTR